MISQRQLLVGVIIVGVAFSVGSVITYQNATGDITNESRADIYNFMKDNYVSQVVLDKYKEEVEAAIAHPHVEFDEIEDRFSSMEKAHMNLMAMVITEETTDVPTTIGGIFNLQTDPEWKRGELITITGMLQVKSSLEATITHETTAYKRTFNVAVFDDRSFTMPFALASDDPLGEYTVTFKSSGKFDSISFEAIE